VYTQQAFGDAERARDMKVVERSAANKNIQNEPKLFCGNLK
jgi:hypothetical protein